MKRVAYGFRDERHFQLRLYALHDCRITPNVDEANFLGNICPHAGQVLRSSEGRWRCKPRRFLRSWGEFNCLAKISCGKQCLFLLSRKLMPHIREIQLWLFTQGMYSKPNVAVFVRSKSRASFCVNGAVPKGTAMGTSLLFCHESILSSSSLCSSFSRESPSVSSSFQSICTGLVVVTFFY